MRCWKFKSNCSTQKIVHKGAFEQSRPYLSSSPNIIIEGNLRWIEANVPRGWGVYKEVNDPTDEGLPFAIRRLNFTYYVIIEENFDSKMRMSSATSTSVDRTTRRE